ncbi:MAG: DUF4838 domain-containing protein, partial [Victivallaceae bacterium]
MILGAANGVYTQTPDNQSKGIKQVSLENVVVAKYQAPDESSYDRSQLSGIKDYDRFANGQDVLFLAKDGKADYNICIGVNATDTEKFAAKTLAEHLKRITGADFAVVSSADSNTGKVIAVGPEAAGKIAPDSIPGFAALGHDGIVIKAKGKNLILTGAPGSRRGTIYAVVTFLENIGCRWWTETEMFVPQKPVLKIPLYDVQYRPGMNYRELYSYNMRNYAVFNKLNGDVYKIPEDHGGKISYRGPYFVHTFSLIVSPKEFFASHPEWFAEIDGKRQAGKWDGKTSGHADSCQLCLSNKELLAFVIGKVKGYLADAPPDSIVSLSQSDGDGPCQCNECRAIEKAEGGTPSGPILRFVNAVADAIKDEYPQAKIDTLAYSYSKDPPTVTKPRDNVQIRLCTFNNRWLAKYDSSANEKFYNDFLAWSKLTPNIYIWDYTTNFQNYIYPFPNLYVTSYNMRLFAQHNVKGIMQQGVFNTQGGDMADLKNWVFAKLLWNPELDEKALANEFVAGYYGKGAPFVSKYLELLYATDPMLQGYVRLAFLEKAYSLFINGRNSVKDNPAQCRKFEMVFAPMLNAIMVNWPFLRQECSGKPWPFPDSPAKVADEFVRICKENNVRYATEQGITPEKWAEKYRVESKAAKEAEEFKHIAATDKLDIQDSSFRYHKKGSAV